MVSLPDSKKLLLFLRARLSFPGHCLQNHIWFISSIFKKESGCLSRHLVALINFSRWEAIITQSTHTYDHFSQAMHFYSSIRSQTGAWMAENMGTRSHQIFERSFFVLLLLGHSFLSWWHLALVPGGGANPLHLFSLNSFMVTSTLSRSRWVTYN